MLGGGRAAFLPKTAADPEYPDKTGKRDDGKDLTAEWLDRHHNQAASYVWNLAGFEAADPASTDRLLGLFEPSHMQYDVDRTDEPSLAEMTGKAIDILSKNPKGYVLMVEGGRIDHAHHEGNAYRALSDTVAFDDAIRAALDKVNLDDTLIVVTADHSHVFTHGGLSHAQQPDPRAGPRASTARWRWPTTASPTPRSATRTARARSCRRRGRGRRRHRRRDARQGGSGRAAVAARISATSTPPRSTSSSRRPYPLESETHGGEDVAIYAAGPFAHLFAGEVGEQFTFHVMRHALGWDAP